MPNDLNGSPLKIAVAGRAYTGKIYVKKMVWHNVSGKDIEVEKPEDIGVIKEPNKEKIS